MLQMALCIQRLHRHGSNVNLTSYYSTRISKVEGLGLQWHLNYIRPIPKFDIYPSWTQYVADVITRFGDPLSTLVQVKQTSKVHDYVDASELAQTQVSLLPQHALTIFLSGLENSIQMQVRMFNPTTISIIHTANLARLHESPKIPIPKIPRNSYQIHALIPIAGCTSETWM